MIFTKEVCPVCNKPTTKAFNTENYFCIDQRHYYHVDEESCNWFKLAFKNFYIKDYLSEMSNEYSFLRDNKGYFLPQRIKVNLNTILLLDINEIEEYLQNLELLS